jgi:hypothetical protein
MDTPQLPSTLTETPIETPGQSTPEQIYETYIDEILKVLDIKDPTDVSSLKGELLKFSDPTKYQLITAFNKPTFIAKIDGLKEADKKIIELKERYDYILNDDDIKKSWDALLQKLTKLQVYIIIKSIRKSGEKCSEIVQAFSEALDTKMGMVNKILSTNIEEQKGLSKTAAEISEGVVKNPLLRTTQKGGNNTSLYYKYIKYKNKYLRLKELLN